MMTHYSRFLFYSVFLACAGCHAATMMRGAGKVPVPEDQERQSSFMSDLGDAARVLTPQAAVKTPAVVTKAAAATATAAVGTCLGDLALNISCIGDCDFLHRRGTCTSKMFLFHGGSCPPSSATTNSDSTADCIDDIPGGPTTSPGDTHYVVVSHPTNTSIIYYQDWVPVGSVFLIHNDDYPIDDYHNVTIYSSDDTTNLESRIQTMILYSPCEQPQTNKNRYWVQELQYASLQLMATAIDTMIEAQFEFHIGPHRLASSSSSYTLDSFAVMTNIGQDAHGGMTDFRDQVANKSVGTDGIYINYTVDMPREFQALGIFATVGAISDVDGTECYLNRLWTPPPPPPSSQPEQP